jgi:hypothetical protein
VTDDGGATGTDIQNVTIGTSNITMLVADLEGTSAAVRNRWTATVTVNIVDDNGTAVGDATVAGAWSNGASGSGSCVTGADGSCSLQKNNLKQNVSSVTFTVTDVAHALYTYSPGSNLETEVSVPAPQ